MTPSLTDKLLSENPAPSAAASQGFKIRKEQQIRKGLAALRLYFAVEPMSFRNPQSVARIDGTLWRVGVKDNRQVPIDPQELQSALAAVRQRQAEIDAAVTALEALVG